MNSLLIEPNLPIDTTKLTQSLNRLTTAARLDVIVRDMLSVKDISTELRALMSNRPDTIIALGSYSWFDRIISTCCQIASYQNTEAPLFAHIAPPQKFAAAWRITPYMEQTLKRSINAIAARKIIEKRAFVCSQKIWFSHSLRLETDVTSSAPVKFLVRTPSGSQIRIEAPAERLDFSVHESIAENESQIISVQAGKMSTVKNAVTQSSQLNLENNIKTKVRNQAVEDVFHIQAVQLEIQAPYEYQSQAFTQQLTSKFVVKPAAFPIRIITEKNDILKY
jgi:hypothetical protein